MNPKLITFWAFFLLMGSMSSGCLRHRPSIRFLSQLDQYPKPVPPSAQSTPTDLGMGARLAAFASTLVGQPVATSRGKTFRSDCSGTTRAIYFSEGISFGSSENPKKENDASTIYQFTQKNGRIFQDNPLPGDLVFFDQTYDQNHDGKMNDKLSHVGVVEKILPDGTLLFVHYMGHSIIRSRMNLKYPTLQYDLATQNRLNHMLRRASKKAKGATTAQLFAGFGRLNNR